jgi:voltage-gated potassium channel
MKNHTLLRIWDYGILAFATASAILIPLRLVLTLAIDNGLLYFEIALTIIFAADLFINLDRLKASTDDYTRTVPRMRAFWIAIDIVAALPFFIVPGLQHLHILRLAKLARVAKFQKYTRARLLQLSNFLRLVFFVYWLSLATHWIACGWLAIDATPPEADNQTRYTAALYWSVQTLSTVGYGDITPQTNAERFFAVCVMLFGVGVYSYVIGNVASLLANIDPAKTHHIENLERLTAFMSYRELPHDLQQRIRHYYNYLWEKRLGYDETAVLSTLPPGLRTEVTLYLKREFLENVPLFKGASEEFIRDIALQMRPVIFTPGDYVFRAGEPGHDMYFVSRGELEVLSEDGRTVHTVLRDGDMVGEIALFFNKPRTASVRAITYSDLYRLDREMFERVSAHYPAIASKIQEKAKQRLEEGLH